jgi:hypothetical protein
MSWAESTATRLNHSEEPRIFMRVRRRIVVLTLVLVALAALDGFLLLKRTRYREETARLRTGMTSLERQRADAIVAADADRATLLIELLRRQAQGDEALHLAVNVDSAFVALDRGTARLRTMSAVIGPERRVGAPPDTMHAVVPRGMRVVERLLGKGDRYELPAWLWLDRGLPVPEVRSDSGWTGAQAIVTTGGVLIYSIPASGPLADSSYVMPGAVRVSAADLVAIRENLTTGTKVYFF